MPCETFRFAWRNDGLISPVFSCSSPREAKRPGRRRPRRRATNRIQLGGDEKREGETIENGAVTN
jgi:hypothetical protein